MARFRRSPQDKKRLSLERDTPLSAEYPKGFRKKWPRKKAAAERAFRHALRQRLVAGDETPAVRRKIVRKWRQPPLGEVIASRARKRSSR
jgi:hypothetical protein